MTPEFLRAWEFLEPAAARWKSHNRETVWRAIEQRRAKLWLLDNSATVATIKTYPSGHRAAYAWLVGGELDEVTDWIVGPFVEYAKRNNCNEMRGNTRRGFLRALNAKSTGWYELGTTIVRDL